MWSVIRSRTASGYHALACPVARPALQRHARCCVSTEADKLPKFMDPKVAHAAKSTTDIVRGLFVLAACQEPIVRNAETFLKLSQTFLGKTLTNKIIKATFFGHFCAGETEEEALATQEKLRKHGVGGILDFAAEGDVTHQKFVSPPLSREYEYESERICDVHTENFMTCIAAAGKGGFAAVKVTALGDAQTIQKLSLCVTEITSLFGKLQSDAIAKGTLNKDRFADIYAQYFSGDAEDAKKLFTSIVASARERFYDDEKSRDDEIDVWEWLSFVTPRTFVDLEKKLKHPPVHFNWTVEDSDKMDRMMARLDKLARKANESNVRIMIDAEHSYFQPAIDTLTLELQRRHNTLGKGAVVFSTYQAYLKDATSRLAFGLQASRREKWVFACKVVRGAYMVRERALAKEQNRPSPIHDTIEDTARSYRECCEMILNFDETTELVVATHNNKSVEEVVEMMQQVHRSNRCVSFAQLYGMSDGVSFGLAALGHPVYKYLPFGPVQEVIPYLVRRAQENSSVTQGAKVEFRLLLKELKRRIFG